MKYVVAVILVTFLLTLPVGLKAQSVNIAYVDIQKVIIESEKGKEAKKALTEEADKLKKTLDGKQEELQRLKDTLEKQSATITPDARAEKEKQYQAKLKDYQRLYNDYQAELQQKDMELFQRILKEIEDVIRGVGDKDKYTLILEKSQAGILFANPAIDVTGKIIALYNEAAKKKPPKK